MSEAKTFNYLDQAIAAFLAGEFEFIKLQAPLVKHGQPIRFCFIMDSMFEKVMVVGPVDFTTPTVDSVPKTFNDIKCNVLKFINEFEDRCGMRNQEDKDMCIEYIGFNYLAPLFKSMI